MAQCTQCHRLFCSTQALSAHCHDKTDHPFCENCDILFSTLQELDQAICKTRSIARPRATATVTAVKKIFCAGCNRWFVESAGLHKHLVASPMHNLCFICSHDFASPSSLDQVSPLCPKRFKTPSSIALHIESGCHKFTRAQVTAAAHALAIVPTISISRRVEGGMPRVVSCYVTERAFNGNAYECYLCHRTFRTSGALNSHVSSPVHDANDFRCPKCEGEYKLISGLMQHIESEGCGIAKFQAVGDLARNLADQFKKRLTLA